LKNEAKARNISRVNFAEQEVESNGSNGSMEFGLEEKDEKNNEERPL
jgi:hypothetical protein